MQVGDLVRFIARDEDLSAYGNVGILVRLGENPYGDPIWLCRGQDGGHAWRQPKNVEVLSENR